MQVGKVSGQLASILARDVCFYSIVIAITGDATQQEGECECESGERRLGWDPEVPANARRTALFTLLVRLVLSDSLCVFFVNY